MASRAQSVIVTYVAWDTGANAGKTGDVANHTLRWVKDGTSSAPTNAAAEVDATNAPGVYKLTLTAAECTCDVGTLAGKSSTANVSIIPLTVTFEQLPTAAPAANGGLPTVGTGAGQVNPDGTGAVPVALAEAVPTSNTANTLGDCLNAARAQGFGKWVIDTTAKTLTLYAPDGATAVRVFTLDSVTVPKQRV